MQVGKTRGVSELVATLLMIAVTLVGFGVYFGVVQRNLGLATAVPIEQFQHQARVAGQQLSLVYHTNDGSNVTLYLYSYGSQNVTLRDFDAVTIVPDSGPRVLLNLSQLVITDAQTGHVIPGGDIPSRSLVCVTAPGAVASPATVALVSTEGAIMEWRI